MKPVDHLVEYGARGSGDLWAPDVELFDRAVFELSVFELPYGVEDGTPIDSAPAIAVMPQAQFEIARGIAVVVNNFLSPGGSYCADNEAYLLRKNARIEGGCLHARGRCVSLTSARGAWW